jgi:hypothetical protein
METAERRKERRTKEKVRRRRKWKTETYCEVRLLKGTKRVTDLEKEDKTAHVSQSNVRTYIKKNLMLHQIKLLKHFNKHLKSRRDDVQHSFHWQDIFLSISSLLYPNCKQIALKCNLTQSFRRKIYNFLPFN